MQWMAVLVGGGVAAGILQYQLNTRRFLARYGDDFREYNNAAFRETVEPCADEHFTFVTRLADEFESKKGQRAIFVQTLGEGSAIQHINQNGTFSARGPYFISWRTSNWRRTGRRHLVKVQRGRGGWGFKLDHYNQKGVIRERGVAILEYATTRYPPVNIRDFVSIKKGLVTHGSKRGE